VRSQLLGNLFRKLPAAAVAAAVLLAAGTAARADSVTGFANFVANGSATIGLGQTSVTLTNAGTGGQSSTAWFNTPVAVGSGFTTTFIYGMTYLPGGLNPADGVTFTVQNDIRGVTALGVGGGGLGYANINNSASVQLNVFSGFTNGTAPGTTLNTQGLTPQFGGNPFLPTAPVDLTSQDPVQVTLSYNSSTNTLSESLLDIDSGATFSTSYSINLASTVGGSTALIGFTGGDGAGTSTQVISNFSFQSTPILPEPAGLTLSFVCVAGVAVRAWRRRGLAS
jgi:hypothetical protein